MVLADSEVFDRTSQVSIAASGADPLAWQSAEMQFVWNRESLRPIAGISLRYSYYLLYY